MPKPSEITDNATPSAGRAAMSAAASSSPSMIEMKSVIVVPEPRPTTPISKTDRFQPLPQPRFAGFHSTASTPLAKTMPPPPMPTERVPGDIWAVRPWAHASMATNAGRTARLNDSSMVLQAAVDGQGVALGRSALALDDLAAGRLVRPFEFSLPTEYAYYILCPERTTNRPSIKTFRDWLLKQADRDSEPGSAPDES